MCGWRGQYGDVFGRKRARLAGKQLWLNLSLLIDIIILRGKLGNLEYHVFDGMSGWIRR